MSPSFCDLRADAYGAKPWQAEKSAYLPFEKGTASYCNIALRCCICVAVAPPILAGLFFISPRPALHKRPCRHSQTPPHTGVRRLYNRRPFLCYCQRRETPESFRAADNVLRQNTVGGDVIRSSGRIWNPPQHTTVVLGVSIAIYGDPTKHG